METQTKQNIERENKVQGRTNARIPQKAYAVLYGAETTSPLTCDARNLGSYMDFTSVRGLRERLGIFKKIKTERGILLPVQVAKEEQLRMLEHIVFVDDTNNHFYEARSCNSNITCAGCVGPHDCGGLPYVGKEGYGKDGLEYLRTWANYERQIAEVAELPQPKVAIQRILQNALERGKYSAADLIIRTTGVTPKHTYHYVGGRAK